ncbi:MAG TPA: hypothetical protein PLI53_04700 [Geobacteraceae bacterium]|nr:hypothetical protein [Geobacteraceae bacterium]
MGYAERDGMDLDHEALREACFNAARRTLEDARPVDVARIDRLADRFYHHAREHVSRIKMQGRDPNILVRAVNYLAHTHAIQPMHDSTEWFFFMMRALVELVCPEQQQDEKSKKVFADIEEGLALARRGKVEE